MVRVIVSAPTERDLEAVLGYYLDEAGAPMARSFKAAWDRLVLLIGEFPESGSPRFADRLEIVRLRVWNLRGHPYCAICEVTAKEVRVLRVMHMARDIPRNLRW